MITIGIVTLNRLPLTKTCISSILSNTPEKEYELIIVDNNSNDGTKKYLNRIRKLSHVRVIFNRKNMMLGRACNQIIEAASSGADWVVSCANDSFFMKGWLSNFYKVVNDTKRKEYIYAKMRMHDYFGRNGSGKKVISPKLCTTESGGTYITKGWKGQVGAGFAVKSSKLKKYPQLRFNKHKNMQYRDLRHTIHKLGFEPPLVLYKPCIIEQDSEFDNPKYKEYYSKVFSMKGKSHHFTKYLSKTGNRLFPRESNEYKEYYKDTGYARINE